MTYDRTDFAQSTKVRDIKRAQEMMPVARLIAGAQPVMNALTQDAHWNRYLTILQGFIERWKVSREAAQQRLSDPTIWETVDLLKLKSDVLIASATIEALDIAIQLPKLILEGGNAAEEFIQQHGVESGASGEDRA